MHYQTRQLIATRDQRFGNLFLTKGTVFAASATDAQHLLARGHAEPHEEPTPLTPTGLTLEQVVVDDKIPGLDNLNEVFQSSVATNDAQPAGNDGTAADSAGSGTDAAAEPEKTTEPAQSAGQESQSIPDATPPKADSGTTETDTVVPRRTITRRSQAAA